MTEKKRVLVIDDNPAIHEDFRKILAPPKRVAIDLSNLEAAIFGDALEASPEEVVAYHLEAADSGEGGLELARTALLRGETFSLAFVDMRMPAGWDGIETIVNLWKLDPNLQIVICTAYSDYSWEDLQKRLGLTDSLLILKKPFDHIEVRQLAASLCRKWELNRSDRDRLEELELAVQQRTADLRHSEERFSTAFRSAPLPQAIIDPERHVVVDANVAFLQLVGCSAEELGTQRDTLLEKVKLTEPLAGAHPMERVGAVVESLTGESRHTQLFTQPTLLDGEPLLLLTARDITERRRLESQLQHSQKMEAVGQLAAGVAHDFNNILTIIQGHLSLHLMSENFDGEVRDSMNEMLDASERAATLTRQLLTFSRKHLFQPRAVRLEELVSRQMGLLRRLMGETIEVTVEATDGLPCIVGDEASIEQAMMNLVINARDAMPSGGRMAITVEAVDWPTLDGKVRTGKFVRISVRDTGTGMANAVRERIFEPFFTTKDVGVGTGMGLATVYGILQQHDGWIDVESTPGEGSVFFVYLPATEDKAEEIASAEPGNTDKVSLDVLLVEDEPAVRAVMRQLLRHCGCVVTEAEDAHQGLKAWEAASGEFDMLVTDIVMPGGMSGHDLAKRLLESKPELKIIYCSGYSAELFTDESELVPGQNFLPKPYSANAVIDLVRKVSNKAAPAELSA